MKTALREGKEEERKRTRRLLAGKDKEIQALKERIEQLQKGSTPQTEGLEFEEKLAARLKREFPEDDVRHKGRGGDVLHSVRSNGTEAGTIIYECKRTPTIQSKHVKQAYQAKQSREADFAVLVTTGQKRGFGGLAQQNGVLVVSPLGVVPLASLLRLHLIEMLKAKITRERRALIARRLLEHITSPQFKNPIEQIVRSATELQEVLKEEVRGHISVWKKRWHHYQVIGWDSAQVQRNLHLVLQGKVPKPIASPSVEPLPLPATTQ
ncbi:MAG: DUF2130 domain-containing protein [Armatimonadota bacterium]|nr:DUF2130 domain-containing protein [Armatimonadota bacterium]